ncbi:MAG: cystathionine gamma-lyase [Cryptosporangiaceae bacterium]|nr:cystathionine gamma-lyase [Cryptosporangiaceae bacterium]
MTHGAPGTGPRGDGTRVIQAGSPDPRIGDPLAAGPVLAAPYHLTGAAGPDRVYGRMTNPTWEAFERAVGELEGGETVVFSSGMAAVTGLFLAILRAGDVLVLPSDGYYEARALAREHLSPLGVEVREVPTAGPHGGALTGARLVLLETPANPGLDVCDIAAVAATAHARGALVAVDNTTATPLGQRPLELGADFSLASDTKALSGHSDLLLGHVSAADPELAARVRTWRQRSGSIPGPFETWLALRSLGTLDLRLARQAENALAVARFLLDRPEVTGVRYPGLPGDPAHALASAQMRRFGGVVSCVLPDAAFVDRALAASALFTAATSFGGLHSTVDRRAQWGGDAVAEGFVRISLGCEDTADLVADLAVALEAAGTV